ncbi:dihydrolipoyl dehydrogenase [Sulfurihydrogenibium azorense]|jgi:dihydrolipoamide dehydrogenase|uniref:Dihydrolipoyl dehydrogenase n=1 Tax=Sulfurihydrogenibium azorense (strain DSM 15241 / OCM 825 / Az-Fu1) TaxID=204536 RepID=C1DT05_SULAA|nr:dihydrolipoyl dehydrogenase [Sulfurihydrogenibium azorense]ACN99012.1 dihydrolipoamide dehydrogenase [Sulfurihydrogenibium azorense Az-Fu1]
MFDLIIIGMGPGGYEAALTALRKKINVAIVEKSKLGGNCLNRACIPTKYLRSGAHSIEKLQKLKAYGIEVKDYSIDYKAAFENKEKSIGFLRKSLEQLLKSKKVPVFKGKGKIIDKNKVEVSYPDGSKEIIEGKNIIIATGSYPASVGKLIPDGNYIITTEDYMEKLDTLPESMLIVGGGVAGCEIGYIAKSYGCQVYITELQDRLLPSDIISPEISKNLLKKLNSVGIKTFFNTTVEDFSIEESKIKVKLSNGEIIVVDKILLTVGRKPNTQDIDTIGIEKDEKGFIKVNSYLQTNFENIYAIGDVVNSPMLAHIASYEAKIVLHNITSQDKKIPDYTLTPWAIFSGYEIGHVGLNEETAKKQGLEVISGYYPFTYNEKAVDELEPEGYVRLYFEKNSKKIIGVDVVGIGASEIIHQIAVFIKEGYTADQVHEFIYFHPSLSEIFAYASYDIAVGKLF